MFIWHSGTKITTERETKPVQHAIEMIRRDMRHTLKESRMTPNRICLAEEEMAEEAYRIEVTRTEIRIYAGSDLGCIYGLLYLSEHYLGVKPFWFWMRQRFILRESVEVPEGRIHSPRWAVRFRGWFFNDEVLFMKWHLGGDHDSTWRMAFEALLRCGGNITIPGTDHESRRNRQLASDMGLWITHHHAEPLGAEMFARAYPDLPADYLTYPDLFSGLWRQVVREQKEMRVVWNLCFRGQGDCPFWDSDTSGRFDTPEKRGRMIEEVIRVQQDIVREAIPDPIFCTNLYGEVMELYEAGCLQMDPQIIKVRADNGFGRMVTRRRDQHCERVNSMPDPAEKGPQGIYYHVSFYDLQAANHITMLPNSVDFVNRELQQVLQNGGRDFWIINCSNVKPHVYMLDAIRKIWSGETVSDASHSEDFVQAYGDGNEALARCYRAYPKAVASYGPHEDDHAGEQLYTENLRILAHEILVGADRAGAMEWLTGSKPLAEQIAHLAGICAEAEPRMRRLAADCIQAGLDTEETECLHLIQTQTRLHLYGMEGVRHFAAGYRALMEKEYKKAFVEMGDCAVCFQQAEAALRSSERGEFVGFYENECLADLRHTAYMACKVMGYIREWGDNIRHDEWYRDTMMAPEDRDVRLLLVWDHHPTDWELYEAMKTSKTF